LFWVALSVIQASDIKLFNAAAKLLETVLRIQDADEGFKKGIEPVYIYYQDGPIKQILAKLSAISGLNLNESFSFGIAGHVLKGLKHGRVKENAANLLRCFLDIAAKTGAGTNILGYLAALLPVEGQLPILAELDLSSGEKQLHQTFFSDQLIPDTKHAALLFTFLVTILEHTDKEHEQLFIYEALKEGILFRPEAFHVVEDILFPRMCDVLLKDQNPALVDCVNNIMESHYKLSKAAIPVRKITRAYLSEIGFHKLPECATFEIEPAVKQEVIKLIVLLLDNILKESRKTNHS